MNNTPFLTLDGVSLTLGHKVILDDISLSVKRQSILGVVGANGSGKSMLFKVITGLVYPTKGQIIISGNPLRKGSFPQSVGALIESPAYLPQYSAYANLKILADIQGNIGKNEIEWALEQVGLDPSDRRPVRKYSLGMKQKVGIAQAIMEKPALLILDEPTSNLDIESAERVRSLIQTMNVVFNATILVTSHLLEDVLNLCDRTIRLANGRIESDSEGA